MAGLPTGAAAADEPGVDPTDPVVIRDADAPARSVSLELAPERTPVALQRAHASRRAAAAATAPEVAPSPGRVDGAQVTYDDVLPGVDVQYAATGAGVKDTTSLASLAAVDALPAGSLTFTVGTGEGLSLRQSTKPGPQSASVEIVDAAGRVAFRRALLRFDELLDVVPADALIATANVKLYVERGTDRSSGEVAVRALTKAFTKDATWTKRTATQSWSTPGGDRTGVIYGRATLRAENSYQQIDVSELMQRWTDGSTDHHGFVLEKTSAVAGGQYVVISSKDTAHPPSVVVNWDPRTGDRKGNSSAVSQQLSDRTSVTVNPATGNAAVTTKELTIDGVGLDVNVAHTSQSLDTGELGVLGHGWTASLSGARLRRISERSLHYSDGAGAQWVFVKSLYTGKWLRPAGLDADLKENEGGTFTLTRRRNRVDQTFTEISAPEASQAIYGLSKAVDKNDHTMHFTYDATRARRTTRRRSCGR